MPTYISLVQFTDKGIQAAKETTQRVADWADKVQSMGVSIKQMYWTLGHYDQVCVFDAPDDETAASVLLAADMLGNIRTQTMRAFTTSEGEDPGEGALTRGGPLNEKERPRGLFRRQKKGDTQDSWPNQPLQQTGPLLRSFEVLCPAERPGC
jgi:uncharacterized protein with GYD domain